MPRALIDGVKPSPTDPEKDQIRIINDEQAAIAGRLKLPDTNVAGERAACVSCGVPERPRVIVRRLPSPTWVCDDARDDALEGLGFVLA
jgi:hypothetical protein